MLTEFSGAVRDFPPSQLSVQPLLHWSYRELAAIPLFGDRKILHALAGMAMGSAALVTAVALPMYCQYSDLNFPQRIMKHLKKKKPPWSEWQTMRSQSACTDETHHSSDSQFYLTVQNHFLLINSHSLNRLGVREKTTPVNLPNKWAPSQFFGPYSSLSELLCHGALSLSWQHVNSPVHFDTTFTPTTSSWGNTVLLTVC